MKSYIAKAVVGPVLDPNERRLADEARRSFDDLLRQVSPGEKVSFLAAVRFQNETHRQQLPKALLPLLPEILGHLARGRGISITPMEKELTTQEAAELLNVSRPYFIKLLKQKRIPYRMVGSHRRVRLTDVLEYKQKTDQQRSEALEELTAQAQELDMGY